MAAAAPESKGLVLVIEDERAIADLERMYLAREGFGVHVESDGRAGLAAARNLHPVAIVLDVGIPTIDGTQVCRTLRADGDWTPILFVTARDDEVEKVLGLELGADDYVTKPFSPRELTARVKAVLRRAAGGVSGAGVASLAGAGVEVDLVAHEVRRDGEPVPLTSKEFDLLVHFLANPRRAYRREELLESVWGWTFGDTATVTVHVRRLREKLEADPSDPRYLVTVRGLGYRFEP